MVDSLRWLECLINVAFMQLTGRRPWNKTKNIHANALLSYVVMLGRVDYIIIVYSYMIGTLVCLKCLIHEATIPLSARRRWTNNQQTKHVHA